MNHAKKWVAIGLAAVMGLTLLSCGKEKEFDYSEGLDKNGYFKGVKASEVVTLPDYKGIDIDKAVLTIADEDLQEQLDGILEPYTTYEQIKDREIKDNDTVNIDYVGSIDGVEFDGGSTGGYGTDVTIGVTEYIDDFIQQLVGHKPGDTFNVEVTFPQDYGKEELNGKDAVFVTTINYIRGDAIQGELTTDIAAGYGFDTVEAMLDDLKNWMLETQKFEFFSELLSKATCEKIPQSILDYIINYDLSQYSAYAAMYEMTVEDVLIMQGYESKQAYIDENIELYSESAMLYLAAQAIAEIEGIVVTDEDLEASEYNEYVEEYGKPYLKQFLMVQTVLPQFIIDNGNVK